MNFFNREQANDDNFGTIWQSEAEYGAALSSCMTRVFLKMFAGLLVTAIAAFAVVQIPALQYFVFGNQAVFLLLLFAPIGLVMAISWGLERMKPSTASFLFYVYAAVNGLTLSVIFFVYDLGTIFQAFIVAGLMFACMAVYGLTTKRDLSSWGSLLFMGLIGIIIASVVNMFVASEPLHWIITYVAVIVFVGLTAYDTQYIRNRLREAVAANSDEAIKKISVFGALKLYLDFINLFLQILKIMGRRR